MTFRDGRSIMGRMRETVKKRRELDMCSRPLLGKIILFALPIMATGILQLLYNAADIITLGQFASDVSAGAVGSTSSLINLTVNLFLGLSVGACTSAARWIGAKNEQRLDRVVHTAILIALIGGVAIGIFGILAARSLLLLMNVPADSVLPLSTMYLQIYFAGMPFNLLYNFGSSLCRARGDSKHPLFFLCAAGVANVGLNIFFVAVCRMDVAGVALGTVISQIISSALVMGHLMRLQGHCKVSLRRLRLYKDALGDILRIGLPAGLQGCIFSLSNVVIQSSVNAFGDMTITANADAANIEGFVYTCMNAVSQACLTFTGQNFGAHRKKNIDVVLIDSLLVVTVLGLLLGFGVYFAGPQILSIYTRSEEVIRLGMQRISVICTTYFLCGIMEVLVGSMRGMGHSVTPMLVSIAGVCGLRIVYIFTCFAANRTLFNLYLSYPISWVATSFVHAVCLFAYVRRREFAKMASSDLSAAGASPAPVPDLSAAVPADTAPAADAADLLVPVSADIVPAADAADRSDSVPAEDFAPMGGASAADSLALDDPIAAETEKDGASDLSDEDESR